MVRPSKFNSQVKFQILNFIQAGNSLDVSARASGINPSTFYRWQEKAKEGDKKFSEFFEKVEKAKAEAEARNVMIINQAAEKTWQAAAWWLERRNPEVWGRKDDWRRESDRATSVEIIIEGEDDDERKEDTTKIQTTSSTT